jgi:parallel beta-helix repeat protein
MTFTVSDPGNSGPNTLRAAIIAANNNLGEKDEIVFDSALFASGVPTIDMSDSITVSEPVWIHSPNGQVRILKAPGGFTEQALILAPSLSSGIGEDFEINDLVIENFKYGIRVNDTGGSTPNSSVEGVTISNNVFLNNERGIFFEDALFPFEISDNQILGRGAGASPTAATDAGIWITDAAIGTNSQSALIDHNFIDAHDDYGIFLLSAEITNLLISNNQIGTLATNSAGILIQNAQMPSGVISDNDIVNNGDGVVVLFTDGIEITDNNISDNADDGVVLSNEANDFVISGNDFIDNGGSAIVIGSGTSDNSIRNRVSQNDFKNNGEPPVDLAGNGAIDTNDTNDTDEGPNQRLNHPVFVEGLIVDEGPRWRVPIDLDIHVNSPYVFEFYRYLVATDEYIFIRSETVDLSGMSGNELDNFHFYFQQGTELNEGDRLAVLVTDDDTGDTSELVHTANTFVDVPALRVIDVVLKGSTWRQTPAVEYSYADIAARGDQLRPIFTQGVDRIQVAFSKHLTRSGDLPLDGSEFTLFGSHQDDDYPTEHNSVEEIPHNLLSFSYDPTTFVATLVFDSPLVGDKYRLEVSEEVRDTSGNLLDGEWNNLLNNSTPDEFDDDSERAFSTGDGTAGTENDSGTTHFELFFSLLPGDYDQNGVVDANDAVSGVVKDGDGDGVVENSAIGDDKLIATANVNTSLPLRNMSPDATNTGDYNDDEAVTKDDFDLWKAQYGDAGANIASDGNADASVNAADYTLYRNNSGDYSAWGTEPPASAAAFVLVEFNATPRVVNVTVSGSSSAHDPFSFDTVDGSGEQLQTVPVGNPNTIAITFSEDVDIYAPTFALRLIGLYTAAGPQVADFSYDAETLTATWRFSGLAANDIYLVALLSDNVTDVDNQSLDGEWSNPAAVTTTNAAVSEFPSGDGTAGGNFNFLVTLLAGDANGDNIVNEDDGDILMASLSSHPLPALFSDGDFNGSGTVTLADITPLSNNAGIDVRLVWLLADLNGDLAVDAVDEEIFGDNLFNPPANPTHDDGDLDGDGDIDLDDLDLFYMQYGSSGLELTLVT